MNLQETTMLFGLVGMLFGANKAFQTIHNVNWFRGNLKLKLIRVLIVNIMIIPSWILVIFTSELFNKQPLEGLAVFLMNSLHFYVLYYFLFGIIPAYIFKRFRLISSEFKVSHLIPQKRI